MTDSLTEGGLLKVRFPIQEGKVEVCSHEGQGGGNGEEDDEQQMCHE